MSVTSVIAACAGDGGREAPAAPAPVAAPAPATPPVAAVHPYTVHSPNGDRVDNYYFRSDHYNFAQKGVPVVFLCDGEHPDYHQVSDSADRLDYARMETIARLAFWTGWQVAEAKDRPIELGVQSDW